MTMSYNNHIMLDFSPATQDHDNDTNTYTDYDIPSLTSSYDSNLDDDTDHKHITHPVIHNWLPSHHHFDTTQPLQTEGLVERHPVGTQNMPVLHPQINSNHINPHTNTQT